MPTDSMYLPVHVGAAGKENIGYQRDDEGQNISELNPYFCELTGIYWAWKNLDADYIGLVHYRRHFSRHPHRKNLWNAVLRYDEIRAELGKFRVFVPGKRRYFIETLYSHYAHTHHIQQLDETRKIIWERCPEYITSFDKTVKQRWGYMFNMMIMEKDCCSDYCSWLFDILFEIQKTLEGQEELSSYQGRFYGRLSEIALNVWLDKKISSGELLKGELMELFCIHMEKINWRKKGLAFCKAKFLGVKYGESF